MTISNSAELLKSTFDRTKRLCADQAALSADMTELRKEAESNGLSHSAIKRLAKAVIAKENGNEKPLQRLLADQSDLSTYCASLGISA